jgi:hypothetical protein
VVSHGVLYLAKKEGKKKEGVLVVYKGASKGEFSLFLRAAMKSESNVTMQNKQVERESAVADMSMPF